MQRLLNLAIASIALAVPCANAQNLDALPPYEIRAKPVGELRIAGTGCNLLKLWYDGYLVQHPKFNLVDCTDTGTAGGIGALYTDMADVAFLARLAIPIETHAFAKVYGYEPLEIVVATGTYDRDETPGTVVFVNSRNPLSQLTLAQVDRILGSGRMGGWEGSKWSSAGARSARENIRTWGQLGLTGDWSDKLIHVYGYDLTVNVFAAMIERKVFHGGDTWNPTLVQFPLSEPGRPVHASKMGAHQAMEGLSADPYGISIGAIKYGKEYPQVKTLALGISEGGPYVEPTKENFTNWSYPLVLPVCMYVNRPPGQPVPPRAKEFLRYILSREGQEQVVKDGSYLPLTAEIVATQLRKLD